jgi:hypothetical protein
MIKTGKPSALLADYQGLTVAVLFKIITSTRREKRSDIIALIFSYRFFVVD